MVLALLSTTYSKRKKSSASKLTRASPVTFPEDAAVSRGAVCNTTDSGRGSPFPSRGNRGPTKIGNRGPTKIGNRGPTKIENKETTKSGNRGTTKADQATSRAFYIGYYKIFVNNIYVLFISSCGARVLSLKRLTTSVFLPRDLIRVLSLKRLTTSVFLPRDPIRALSLNRLTTSVFLPRDLPFERYL